MCIIGKWFVKNKLGNLWLLKYLSIFVKRFVNKWIDVVKMKSNGCLVYFILSKLNVMRIRLMVEFIFNLYVNFVVFEFRDIMCGSLIRWF